MTSLMAWAGVDSRGAASIYLAADSRLSWPDGSFWDQGRKLFAAQTEPEILGYCGDVLFPSQAVGQVITAIDSGALIGAATPEEKVRRVSNLLNCSLNAYPEQYRQPFSILYCTRMNQGMASRFTCFELDFKSGESVTSSQPIKTPDQSGIIAIKGSGGSAVKRWTEQWFRSEMGGGRTSRAAFGGFCDAVRSGDDPATGGAAQLVGLYRTGSAKSFGVSWNGQGFLGGLSLNDRELSKVEWRNELFERTDPDGNLLAQAQRQPRPVDIDRD